MKISRRSFIKATLCFSGALSFPGRLVAASQKAGQRWTPGYAKLEDRDRLAHRIEQARAIFETCRLCTRECGVNRLAGEEGFCRATSRPMVYSAHPHFGEEVSLVGKNGSGTIFFSNCNLRCVFCQNWPISHEGRGKEISDAQPGSRNTEICALGGRQPAQVHLCQHHASVPCGL
jgi:putative pyruvate formate lyase activating enzyme